MHTKSVLRLVITACLVSSTVFSAQQQESVLRAKQLIPNFSTQQKIAAGLVTVALLSAVGYKSYAWYKNYLLSKSNAAYQKELEQSLVTKIKSVNRRLQNVHQRMEIWPNRENQTQKKVIWFYQRDKPYYEFANFYPAPITINTGIKGVGNQWYTSEHYYQSQKYTNSPDIMISIQKDLTPRKAVEFAQIASGPADCDWRGRNLWVMYRALAAKFSQHKKLRDLLLGTGNAVLIFDAGANDLYFGAGANYAEENYLGRLLMMIRDDIRDFDKLKAQAAK